MSSANFRTLQIASLRYRGEVQEDLEIKVFENVSLLVDEFQTRLAVVSESQTLYMEEAQYTLQYDNEEMVIVSVDPDNKIGICT